MSKKIIIIVPGAKYIKSRSNFMQGLILVFYKLTRIMHPVDSNYAKDWRYFFSRKDERVIWLHWGRGFTNLSKWFAVRKLKRLLKHYESYSITLLGMSLGGEIVLEAAESFPGKIKRVIVIASTNEKKKFNLGDTPVINIYSIKDFFQKLAVKTLSPIAGSVNLVGSNVLNIRLPNLAHDEILANKKIKSGKFKDKTILEVVNYFLRR